MIRHYWSISQYNHFIIIIRGHLRKMKSKETHWNLKQKIMKINQVLWEYRIITAVCLLKGPWRLQLNKLNWKISIRRSLNNQEKINYRVATILRYAVRLKWCNALWTSLGYRINRIWEWKHLLLEMFRIRHRDRVNQVSRICHQRWLEDELQMRIKSPTSNWISHCFK